MFLFRVYNVYSISSCQKILPNENSKMPQTKKYILNEAFLVLFCFGFYLTTHVLESNFMSKIVIMCKIYCD